MTGQVELKDQKCRIPLTARGNLSGCRQLSTVLRHGPGDHERIQLSQEVGIGLSYRTTCSLYSPKTSRSVLQISPTLP